MACKYPLEADAFSRPRFTMRKATIDDLDVMVEIALTTMPMDPQWDWRFPYRFQFPEDTRLFTRAKYEEMLVDASNQWLVMLAEHKNHTTGKPTAAAMAIWDMKNINLRYVNRQCDNL